MFPSHDQSMLAGFSGFVKNIFEAKKLRSLSFIAMKMIFLSRKTFLIKTTWRILVENRKESKSISKK